MKRIIIYGAGNYGVICQKVLALLGKTVNFFCDRNLGGNTVNGVVVISPEALQNYREDVIYIAVKNSYWEVKKSLQKIGCRDLRDISELLKTAQDMDTTVFTSQERDLIHRRISYNSIVSKECGIPHLEAVITERCNLCCRDCSDLMQYYEKPQNISAAEIENDINRLLEGVGCIGELRILGGEPFLNPELTEIVKSFSNEERIGEIIIFTNGTVIPRENTLKILAANDINIHISDYGLYRENREQLINLLKKEGIRHYVRKYDRWIKFGDLKKRDDSREAAEAVFKTCASSWCITLHRGKVFRCPRSAHGFFLGAIPPDKSDYVDLTCDKEKIKEEIFSLLYEKRYVEACKYCNGTGKNDSWVRAAVQQKGKTRGWIS